MNLDVPAGRVVAEYRQDGQYVEEVRITNVPSFLHSRDLEIDAPGLGKLKVDVAYGGNFYCIVDPQENFTDLADISVGDILRWSPALRPAMNERYSFIHPEKPEHPRAAATSCGPASRRSPARPRATPCSTATRPSTARPAAPAPRRAWRSGTARGKLKVGDAFIHESIIGSIFNGRVEKAVKVGDYDGIVPSIAGWARQTGHQHHLHRRPRPVRPRLLPRLGGNLEDHRHQGLAGRPAAQGRPLQLVGRQLHGGLRLHRGGGRDRRGRHRLCRMLSAGVGLPALLCQGRARRHRRDRPQADRARPHRPRAAQPADGRGAARPPLRQGADRHRLLGHPGQGRGPAGLQAAGRRRAGRRQALPRHQPGRLRGDGRKDRRLSRRRLHEIPAQGRRRRQRRHRPHPGLPRHPRSPPTSSSPTPIPAGARPMRRAWSTPWPTSTSISSSPA